MRGVNLGIFFWVHLLIMVCMVRAAFFYKKEASEEKARQEHWLEEMHKAFDQRDEYIKAAEVEGISLYKKVQETPKTLGEAVRVARGGEAPIQERGFA